MINETIILLTPFEDCSNHRLAKYVIYLKSMRAVPFDVCFYQPLKKIFPKVIVYDYLNRMIEIGVREVNQEIIELVRKERPKYVLWVAFGEYYEIQESTFDTIRKEGAKIIGWFFDVNIRFNYYCKWWLPYIDYFVTDDAKSVLRFREIGAWATHAICTGSAVDYNWSNIQEKYDVSFIGSIRADREHYINKLKNKNVPVHLFGLSYGKFLPYNEMIKTFGASKINLNFSKTYASMKLGVKARIFEVCLSGGFLLTEYFPGIENYFEIDKEIVCFHDAEEMIQKIIYYLNHDKERRIIAHAGWERATNEYTCFHMMSRVFHGIEEYLSENKISKSEELIMPIQIKKRISSFYTTWGIAYLFENYKNLWKDALSLSLVYNPFNVRARVYYIIGSLPFSMRFVLIRLLIFVIKLRELLFTCLLSIPHIRETYCWFKMKLLRKYNRNE